MSSPYQPYGDATPAATNGSAPSASSAPPAIGTTEPSSYGPLATAAARASSPTGQDAAAG